MTQVNLGKVPHHFNEKYQVDLPDGVPRPPILGLYVGKRGQGKSTAAVRLLKYYTDHNPEVFQKELTFVISPTADSQQHLWDHLGLKPENVYTVSTGPEIRKIVDTIIELLAAKKKKHDDDEEYREAYNRLVRGEPLSTRQELLLDSRDAQPLRDPEPWPRPVLLLDDLSHMKVLDRPWFVSLCLRHRHVAGGVSLSILMLTQSLRGGTSRVVRQNCSLICLFSTHDHTAKEDLYQECCHLLDRDEFMAVFNDATKEHHSFMALDLSQKDANRVFSRDFQHWYQIQNVPEHSRTFEEHPGGPKP